MSAASPIAVEPRAARAAVPRAAAPVRGPSGLEERLVAEVRAPAGLRRALARVTGRMVATRGWERLGFARLGDYAVERAGISGRELRDLARVDAACAAVPELEAAFLAGSIGWTRLRLLCRVARPEDAGAWLERASRLSARALAREVRAVDRCARDPVRVGEGPPGDDREAVVLRISRPARARWWAARQVAQRVAGHALSHGAFAEVLAAEVLSGVPLEAEGVDPAASLPSAPRVEGGTPRLRRLGLPAPFPPPAADPDVVALGRGLEDVDAFELDRRLRWALQREARGLARVASLLGGVVRWGLHRDLGYSSLDAYAEERLGMAASRARALLRVERASRHCPALREAFASGRLSWVQAHALVPLLLEPAAQRDGTAWIEHARSVSVRRLGDDVERALATGAFSVPPRDPEGSDGDPAAPADGGPAGLQTGATPRLPAERERLFFTASSEAARLFRAVLATVQRRLERARGRPACRSEALEAMLDHALASWEPEAPRAREWRVFERDGWRCTAPGCTSHRNLERHHIVFRSQGGSDRPENLTTLCAWHHRRGIHGHVLRCTGAAPGRLRFELGLRDGAPPLAVYRSGDVGGGNVGGGKE